MKHQASPLAVVGGGIVGLSCALELIDRYPDVALIDPGDLKRAASYGNAGQLALGEVVPLSGPGILRSLPGWLTDPLGPLAIRWRHFPHALPWFLRFIRESRIDRVKRTSRLMADLCDLMVRDYPPFLAATGTAHLIVDEDYLRVYTNEQQWRAEGYRWKLREAAGLRYDLLRGHALHELAPDISPAFSFGVTMKGRRFISSLPLFIRALEERFRTRGGKLIKDEVRGFEKSSGRITALRLQSGNPFPVNQVVIAAGAWSGRLSAMLGDRVPLESERGYHVMLPDPGIHLSRTMSYVARGLVAIPMREGLRLAGTVEFAGLDAPPNFARAEKLIDAARLMLPRLNVARAEFWMGHRPSLPDSLPIIDRASSYTNAFYAFGHGHMGLSWAPTTGKLLASLVAGTVSDYDIRPFRLGRFHRHSQEGQP